MYTQSSYFNGYTIPSIKAVFCLSYEVIWDIDLELYRASGSCLYILNEFEHVSHVLGE